MSDNSCEMNYFIKLRGTEMKKKVWPVIKKIGEWENFGSLGFRGNTSLQQEELINLITSNTDLKSDDFEVFSGLGGFTIVH